MTSFSSLSTSQDYLVTLLFDVSFYSHQSFADADNLGNPLEHYIDLGWKFGLDPSATFRSARYLNATSGLRSAGRNPFLHYLFETVGETVLSDAFAGLNISDVMRLRSAFDANWYLFRYPDVEARGHDAFIDYMTTGWRRLTDPSRRFSTKAYLDRYPDIRDCGANPFQHWVLHGIAEGRSGAGEAAPFSSWDSLQEFEQAILSRMFSIDHYYIPFAGTGIERGAAMARHICSLPPTANPTPSFRTSRYIASRTDILDDESIPFLVYLFGDVGDEAMRALFSAVSVEDLQALVGSFDAPWYLYSYPDIEASGQDAFVHYMTVGWRERRDSSPIFSTSAYLLRYPDIAECGMNPYLHWVLFGKAEGRSGLSSSSNFRNRPYAPRVTAIMVDRRDASFDSDCIDAVLRQSYRDLDVLIIGGPQALSREGASVAPDKRGRDRTPTYLPLDTSESYWETLGRAVERATGDLVWIIQRPVVHDVDFLARLTSSFADNSVQLGFGRQLDEGDAIAGDRSLLQMQGWTRHSVVPAARWFPDNLTPELLAALPSSVLWRRRGLDAATWRQAADYRYLGFWHLYLHMASGGQIATVRDALIQPPTELPALSRTLGDVRFYSEVGRLAAEIRSCWTIRRTDRDERAKAFVNAYAVHVGNPDLSPIAPFGDCDGVVSGREPIRRRHVLIVTHGIFAGGAENFPIQLANALARYGIIVSMLIFKIDDVNADMRATLDPGVSIYEAEWVLEYGCRSFTDDIGCSIIHSHGVVSEMFFFGRCDCAPDIPYIATLHGSYEASNSKDLPDAMIARIIRNVDLFVYTADKNLKPLLRHDVRPERLVKLSNAMPVDETPFPAVRAEMGIADDAIVFTLVARGIKEKGWSTAIKAFKAVRTMYPDRRMHLCLVGEGDEPDRLKPIYGGDPAIIFLGFQLRIHGLYRLTDVAIVPTRFAGESFPLCIIQALQVGVPVVATDVGEIASMLHADGVVGGIVVKPAKNDREFDHLFASAMQRVVDDEYRKTLSRNAAILGQGYDMGSLTKRYIELYDDTIRLHADRSS